jgi:chromosome segregation ATPase
MSEIAELERRITSALDRIGAGVEKLGPRGAVPVASDTSSAEKTVDAEAASGAEVDALREALASEKVVSAQLEERIKALRERQEAQITALKAQVDELKTAAREATNKLQQSRSTNQQLQTALQSLRQAGADAMPEPHLINQAMMSELEGLRSIRDADRAEMDAILGSLKPLLGEESNA